MKTFKKTLAVVLSALMMLSVCSVAFAEDCPHENLAHVEANPNPICGENGNIECWMCCDCYQYFADEEKTQPISYSEAYCIAPQYDEHDIQYELGFEEREDRAWLSYPSYYDSYYQQNYGKTMLQYYTDAGCTFWYCGHCGAVQRYGTQYGGTMYYNYSALSDMFTLHNAPDGVDPNEGFNLLPTADSDELTIGDYYFDVEAFITFSSMSEESAEIYRNHTAYYLSADGETLRMVIEGISDPLDVTRSDGSMYFNYLKQHQAPCAHAGKYHMDAEDNPICGETGHIACWRCSDCSKYFADEACTQELTYGEVYSIASEYAEHDFVNQLWFGYSEENEWVYYPESYDAYYQQEYGMTLAEYYAANNVTIWHCSHCGYLTRTVFTYDDFIYNYYNRLSEMFTVYQAGEEPVDPLAQYGDPLPVADSDELEDGDYYFDLAAFIALTSGEATEEELAAMFAEYAEMYKFFLIDDGETLVLAYMGGAYVQEYTRDGEGSFYFMFLKQHGVEPADQLEGFTLVAYDISDIPYGGWLFLIDDYLADYAASMVGKTNSETNEPYTEDEIAAEIADIREEILGTSMYVNKAENKFALRYSFMPAPMIFDLDDEDMAEITAYLTEYDPWIDVALTTDGLAAGDYWFDVVDYFGEEGDEEEIAAFTDYYVISVLPELAAIRLHVTPPETSLMDPFDYILTPDGDDAEDYEEFVQYIYLTFADSKESTCTEAGYEDAVAIEKNGETVILVEGTPLELAAHTPGEPVKENDVPSTCYAYGSYDMVTRCTACGEPIGSVHYDYDTLAPHDFTDWAEDYAPTCTEKGQDSRTCRNEGCGLTETRDVDPLTHNYVGVVTAPTCTERGYTTYTCTRCPASYVDDYVMATGHTYGAWTTVTAATCHSEGLATRTCACGDVQEKVLDIDANNHDGETELRGAVAATCTSAGYTGDTYCLGCDQIKTAGSAIPGGHSWGEWTVTREATASEAGEKTRECAVCHQVETQTIPATGDNVCRWCGEVHTGYLGLVIAFFHSLLYLFSVLFGTR